MMKLLTTTLTTAGLLALSAGSFWFYGGLRTMDETFLLALGSIGKCIVISGLPVTLLLVTVGWLKGRTRATGTAVLILLAWFVGIFVAEGLILQDEALFLNEASEWDSSMVKDGDMLSRPRRWPHGSATLVFTKGQGFHSTD